MWIAVAVVGGLVAVVLLLAASKPSAFRIERTQRIEAPAERVFEAIADFHQWTSWSPWEKLDPQMSRSFSGAASGAGAAYAWQGNKKVGAGRMEILTAEAPRHLAIDLHFLKPFEARNTTEFTIVSSGAGVSVTWAMHGRNNFGMKLFGLVMNMDKMVGRDFENGLQNLKQRCEGR